MRSEVIFTFLEPNRPFLLKMVSDVGDNFIRSDYLQTSITFLIVVPSIFVFSGAR
jgi:hypothetical protein